MKAYHTTNKRWLKKVMPLKQGRDGVKYACVSACLSQARYWMELLQERGGEFVILEVEIPDDMVVEDCVNHYRFERPGRMIPASSINVVSHSIKMDGEICVFKPVKVIREV